MSATQVSFERRPTQRFYFTLSMAVRHTLDNREGSGFTQDLSAKGIFFYSDLPLAQGDSVELTLVMPSEITLAESMRVRCRGKVVRVTPPRAGSAYGAAVRLEGYEFLPEPESMPRGSGSFDEIPLSKDSAEENTAGMVAHTFSARNAGLR